MSDTKEKWIIKDIEIVKKEIIHLGLEYDLSDYKDDEIYYIAYCGGINILVEI